VPPETSRRATFRLAAGVLPLLMLLAAFVVLQRPAPIFVNLGAGDEDLVHGFRETGAGRPSPDRRDDVPLDEDGARLELPLSAKRGDIHVRLRLARFADSDADVRVIAGGKVVDNWHQAPRGWRIRTVTVSHHGGPLTLQFRSDTADGTAMGIALDWVELRGVNGVRPAARLFRASSLFFAGIPLLVAFLLGLRPALVASALLPASPPSPSISTASEGFWPCRGQASRRCWSCRSWAWPQPASGA